jgi:DNA mismatch repair protein MutS2
MKCYNKRTYEKLGFDVIRAEVAKRALGPEAREEAQHLGPIDDRKQLLAELQQVNELREVLLFDDPFPLNRIPAMARILDSLRLEGSWVPAESLSELLSWLVNIKDTRAFLHSRREKYPALYQLIQPLGNPKALIEAIDAVIDERGEIRDNASPDLVRIRKEIRSASNEVRVLLNRVLRKAQEKNWTDAPEITLRNDRLVVPVKAENKSRISGFVQDVSSSGNTVFVEPTEALSLNNRLRELQIREQNELVRILMEIASEIREHLDELSASRKLMIRLDLVGPAPSWQWTSMPFCQPLPLREKACACKWLFTPCSSSKPCRMSLRWCPWTWA